MIWRTPFRLFTTGTILQRSVVSLLNTPGSSSRAYTTSSRMLHAFAGLGLDRSSTEIKEPAFSAKALAQPTSRFLPLYEAKPLVLRTPDGPPRLSWKTLEGLQGALGISAENLSGGGGDGETVPSSLCIALGHEDGAWHFGVEVGGRGLSKEETEAKMQEGGTFENVRTLLPVMGVQDVAAAGQAAALLNWHGMNKFCGVCGSPMVPMEAGARRKCTSCRNRAYPRTDPVCIVLVYDPATDTCLLGRQRIYRPGMYSCLAGFVEQCESLEEAVRREVQEESGVVIGRCTYHSSQPWPIGRGASCQLMVGFMAEAVSTTIVMDRDELEDVRWFTREEVAAAKELIPVPVPGDLGNGEEEKASLSIPGPYAIAHHLIKHWLSLPPRHRL